MGAEIAASRSEVRVLYDRANAVLGYDLAKLCFEGPVEQLDTTVVSQPALFVTSLAALEVLKADRPDVLDQCQAAAGLSLGEYTALAFAGVLEFEDGLKLVQERGAAMQAASDATPSGMVSILGLDRDRVAALCAEASEGEVLEIANLLCPGNIAVSGTLAACRRVAELAPAAGAMKAVPLAVAGAFHTSIMASAVERLRAALANVPLRKPRLPVISNVDAQSHDDPEAIRALLVQQVCSPVRWEDSMHKLLASGVDQFWEVGPGRVLRGLLKRIDRKVESQGVLG